MLKKEKDLEYYSDSVIDNESARLYFDKIDYTRDFLQIDSRLLSIIGDCYNRFAEYNKALEFYQKSLDVSHLISP